MINNIILSWVVNGYTHSYDLQLTQMDWQMYSKSLWSWICKGLIEMEVLKNNFGISFWTKDIENFEEFWIWNNFAEDMEI